MKRGSYLPTRNGDSGNESSGDPSAEVSRGFVGKE